MAEPKPLASLSSGLLARKGHAKPAMRRQGFDGMTGFGPNGYDDLGWNDMGHDGDPDQANGHGLGDTPVHRQIEDLEREITERRATPATGLTPLGHEPEESLQNAKTEDTEEVDEVVAAEAAEVEPHSSPLVEATVPYLRVAEKLPVPVIAISRAKREAASRAKSAKGKAAFTLRLDNERHLKLRLASAIERVSAQHLVTMALDRLLESMPDIETLADNAADHRKIS